MARYGYFPEDEFKVSVSTTFDRKQFGELELVGTLMQYKQMRINYWDKIGVGGSVTTCPLEWNGLLYFGACDKNFYCMDLEGREKWRFRTDGVILGRCAIRNGTVFFGSYDHNIYALDCVTGELVWKFPTGGPVIDYITCHEGAIYIGSLDHNVYVINAETGKEIWRIQTSGEQHGIAQKDGKIYFGYGNDVYYCYDIRTRKELWRIKLSRLIMSWKLDFWGENVYIGTYEGDLYAINRESGNVVWKFNSGSARKSLEECANRLYFGFGDGNLCCIDAESGRLIWKFSTSGNICKVVHLGGKVYFGSYDNNVYCLDSLGGREIWRFSTAGFVTDLSVIGGRVYFGSWDCNLYCLNKDTGELIWKFKTSLGTPSPIEPPETGIVTSAQVVWQSPEEEKAKAKQPEQQFSDYANTKTEYASVVMGDYLGKKKRGYV